jgi:hypothetical protein
MTSRPEMQRWADTIRGAIVLGHSAARLGLDPSQRDKVIGVRRQLGEYGRMARFVGSMHAGMTQNYRRLGQAMDEMSAVLLVMLGESLASVGFASGYYLLQVPLAEVQQRRDAVIFALRNFMGGAREAYGPDDWPRGIDAYRRVYKWLEDQGQGDLRTLLLENDIAQIMDALITRAQNGTPEGLRALGVTAQLDIERFRRMAIVAPGAMTHPDGFYDRSPPLEAYLQALELFAETFKPAGGLRLLRIARPPILFYGIYNPNLLEDDRDLVDLIMVRGNLATIFDGLFPPGTSARQIEPQVLLDMLLLELDRGIDLLALGANPKIKGPTERRADAYWLIVQVIQNLLQMSGNNGSYTDTVVYPSSSSPHTAEPFSQPFGNVTLPPSSGGTYNVALPRGLPTSAQGFPSTTPDPLYVYLVPERQPGGPVPTARGGPYLVQLIAGVWTITGIPARNIQLPPVPPGTISGNTLMPSPLQWGGNNVALIFVSKTARQGPIADLFARETEDLIAMEEAQGVPLTGMESQQTELVRIAKTYQAGITGVTGLQRALDQYQRLHAVRLPAYLDTEHLTAVAEELRVQGSLEERWQNLVRTVAPEASDRETIFRLLKLVIKQAAYDAEQLAGGVTRLPRTPTALPPQFEQSLEAISRRIK